MLIFPAIDIKNGLPVRLYKGDFDTAEQVAASVVETAKEFNKVCTQLHLVDLDGAKLGTAENYDLICETVEAFDGFVEVGGGIRNIHTVKHYIDAGVERVILGTTALKDPGLLKELAASYGDKIAVGIDARDGFVATDGWLDSSNVGYIDFARQCEHMGISTIIFTDISKDGTLSGPNIEQTKALRDAVSCTLLASGGIHSIEDLVTLNNIGIDGAICGKSLYHGKINLKEAIAAVQGNK